MATSNEEPVVLERTSRSTRGKRISKLLDDEMEQDEQFWNQDAFVEEENDENYEEEGEAVDVFDSDFDEDEPEPDEEVDNDGQDRERPKKRLIFPGKTVKKKNKKKDLSKMGRSPQDGEPSQKQLDQSKKPDNPDDFEGERTVRKSTRTLVIVRQAERDAIRAALQATTKPIKRKKEGEEKRMTQEEMLLEAAQTEIKNLRNLERVLAREEEVKKKAVVHKAVYNGPQVRYSSKNGQSYLEFSKGLSFQSEICTAPVSYPEKVMCAVTGLPAKGYFTNLGREQDFNLTLVAFTRFQCQFLQICLMTKHDFPILDGTVIRRLGYLMQTKKPSELFGSVSQMKIVEKRRKRTRDSFLIQFLDKDFLLGRRDQLSQIKVEHHICATGPAFVEFQLLKVKIWNSSPSAVLL